MINGVVTRFYLDRLKIRLNQAVSNPQFHVNLAISHKKFHLNGKTPRTICSEGFLLLIANVRRVFYYKRKISLRPSALVAANECDPLIDIKLSGSRAKSV